MLASARTVLLSVLLAVALLPLRLASRPALLDSDLVLARASCSSRIALAHATRAAGGRTLRAVTVVETPQLAEDLQKTYGADNQTFLSWPDRPDPKKPGDTRVALVPWLVHKALGDTYKWLLYGDDDTFFFAEGVKTLLADYDHNLPYMVTDVIWHKRHRYMSEAPRCLPCHVTEEYRTMAAEREDRYPPKRPAGAPPLELVMPPVPPAGCPCTPQLACAFNLNVTGRKRTLRRFDRTKPEAWCGESAYWGFPEGYPTPCDYPHFHGGSGVLISVGAMRKVSYEAALGCFYDDTIKLTAAKGSLKAGAHSDRMAALCFWMHGVATTDPGLALSHLEFSNAAGRVMDSRTAKLDILRETMAGTLAPSWLWQIVNMAAVHVGHRPDAVKVTERFAELYPRARAEAIRLLKEQGGWGHGELGAQLHRGSFEGWVAAEG